MGFDTCQRTAKGKHGNLLAKLLALATMPPMLLIELWQYALIASGAFATMVANAAGPVAALYFIASGLPKYAYIGTSAWFFLLVNLFKVPLMVDLQIIDRGSLLFSARFMVYAVLGAITAPLIVKHINQKLFELLIWVFVIVGGLKLIIP